VIIGLFIGGLVPYLFGAMAMEAVGARRARSSTRSGRQFREIKGHHGRHGEAGYARRCRPADEGGDQGDDRAVAAADPLVPVVVAFGMNALMGPGDGISALGGLLIGTIVDGPVRRDLDVHGRRAWDNAKKYIEGRATSAARDPTTHKAAVHG
jgi:K(+)-stimulated pyrophosphate-energized sodium pump